MPERTGPGGVLTDLDEDGLRRQLHGLRFEAAAVCLLWGFRHPDHERRTAALVEEAQPGAHVSVRTRPPACSASTSDAPPPWWTRRCRR